MYRYLKTLVLLSIAMCAVSTLATAQKKTINLGAYYFDGWTGTYPYHITQKLQDSFPERKPVWGWVTSKQKIVDEQINLAASAGISFFNFCWYFAPRVKNQPLNNALSLYLKSPNKKKLKFCLMVANNSGFQIGPYDWDELIAQWVDYFQSEQYLRVNGKPYITFFSVQELIKQFGTSVKVKNAFDKLRAAAQAKGLPGVTIGACTSASDRGILLANMCGFDVLTGYNYHSAGFKKDQLIAPIDSLREADYREWNKFLKYNNFYIPVTTLNWDPRPWSETSVFYKKSQRYVGYSASSIKSSIGMLRKWLKANPGTSPGQTAMVYAWNENGEGAWLTPNNSKNEFLNALKAALN